MVSAVAAGAEEDEGSAGDVMKGKGALRGHTSMETQRAKSRQRGQLVCSKVATAWHFGKEDRTTGAVRVETGLRVGPNG